MFSDLGTEIELKIASLETDVSRDRAEDIFYLEGKKLKLRRPLDRDENDLSSLIFQVKILELSKMNPESNIIQYFSK